MQSAAKHALHAVLCVLGAAKLACKAVLQVR